MKQGVSRFLSLTFGTIGRLIKKILEKFTIESRVVQGLTKEIGNGLDDGQNIELLGASVMTDVIGFIDEEGNDLNFLEQRSRISHTFLSRWYEHVLRIMGAEIGGAKYFNPNLAPDNQLLVSRIFPNHYLVDEEFLKR